MIQKHTIGIIGTGNVGIAAAYALFLNRTAGEIILIDKDRRRAEGEAMDLMHGQPYVCNLYTEWLIQRFDRRTARLRS